MAAMRRKPYTERGITRVPCTRCGRPSSAQWHLVPCACPELKRWVGLCRACDVKLNALVMGWFKFDGRDALLAAYTRGDA